MAAPFDFDDVSVRADRWGDQILDAHDVGRDKWDDPPLGALQRVYALLTYRPENAFDEPVTKEYLAECRMYAALYLSAIYDRLVGAMTCDDVFIDLLTQFDSLVDAKLVEAMESAKADARKQLTELKKAGTRVRARKPGSVRRIRPGTDK